MLGIASINGVTATEQPVFAGYIVRALKTANNVVEFIAKNAGIIVAMKAAAQVGVVVNRRLWQVHTVLLAEGFWRQGNQVTRGSRRNNSIVLGCKVDLEAVSLAAAGLA